MSVGNWWDAVRRAAVERILSRALSRRRRNSVYGQRKQSTAEGLEARIVLSSATHLVFAQGPTSGVTNSALGTIIVDVEGATNTVVITDTSTVTLTLSTGTFSTGSSTISMAAVNGVATFSGLMITAVGTYTVTATDGTLATASGVCSVYSLDSLNFAPPPDGTMPFGNVILDSSGSLYGTTYEGGAFNDGTVFELAAGSSSPTILGVFNGTNGANPIGGLTFDSSGDLYGTTSSGPGEGVFEITRGAITINVVASFTENIGALSDGGVVFDNNGDLFGTTALNGSENAGVVFEIPHNSTTFTEVVAFNGTNGYSPECTPVLDSSGNLYGTTYGSANGGPGTIFEVPKGSTTLITLATFNGTDGENPTGGLTLDTSGDLYGTTPSGGATGYGVLFELPAGSSTIKTIISFNETNGARPYSPPVFDSRGDLLGTTSYGTVFEIPAGTTTITTIATFNGTDGADPLAGITVDSSGDLFGDTQGGPAVNSSVFEIRAGTSSITDLCVFTNPAGEYPLSGLLRDTDGDFFGTTVVGGTSNLGTVFELPSGTNSIVTLSAFNEVPNGYFPQTPLTIDTSGDLLGTTSDSFGGVSGAGSVFEVPAGTTTVRTIVSFNTVNGWVPSSNIVLDSSGDLFGATSQGGSASRGNIFEIPSHASTVTSLASFIPSTGGGYYPDGNIVVDSHGDVFGTTTTGGADGDGTVFELVNGSSTITTIASFFNTNGSEPVGGLTFDSSGDLYGTTQLGGASNDGALFEIPSGTSTINLVASFNSTTGIYPANPVVFDSSGDLYGSTPDYGDLFEVPHGTTTLITIAAFNFGATPTGPLLLDSYGDIFGTTGYGGTGTGNIFELAISPSKLAFTSSPTTPVPAGAPMTIQVEAIDGFGQAMPGTSVTLSLNGGVFSSGSSTVSLTGVNGVATFSNLMIDSAGTFTLTASAGSSVSISSTSFTVSPLAASTFGFIQQPTGVAAGLAISPAVTLATEDMYGNPVSTPSSAVTLTLNGGVFAGGSNVTTTTSVNGMASFGNLVIDAAGSYTVTATGSYSGATSNSFAVSPLSPTMLAFAQPPSNAPSGVDLVPAVTVAVQDRFGNTVLTDTSTVTLTLNGATFAGGSSTATAAAVNGTATFASLIIDTPGTYTLTASDSTDATTTATSNGFTISLQSKLAFVQPPSSAMVGAAMSPAVAVAIEDINGNTVTADSSTVTLTLNGGGFAGGGNTVSTPAVNGVATFSNLVIDSTGSYTLSATDGLYAAATSGSFAVTSVSPSSLTFLVQPGNGAAAVTINPAVQIELRDQFGNLVSNSEVTLTLNGGVFAGGSTTATAVATAGIATFGNLVIDIAASYTVTASDAAITKTSNSFSIVAGAPVKLQIIKQPVAALAGTAIATPVTVAIEDTWGNVVSSAPNSVTLTLNGDAFATGSTTTAAASNGTARFANLIVNAPGTFTLTATSGSLPSAVSGAFNVYAFQSIASFTAAANLLGTVVIDSNGNLFGTTELGGSFREGTIFEVPHNATTIVTLATFDQANGEYPLGGLTIDSSGDLFGTAGAGGVSGDGTVFELVHNAPTVTVLASFNLTNGMAPYATLTLDSSGNLFGTASAGGAYGYGVIFEIVHLTTTIKVLASFDGANGETPEADLTLDSHGDLFGTTYKGGATFSDGTAFELAVGSTSITTLASFNAANGESPVDVPVLDSSGDLFGTTEAGGTYNIGTVFEIVHGTTTVTTLASFNGTDGRNPEGNLFLDSNGNLFGTTEAGGTSNDGTVFEIASGSTSISTWTTFNSSDGENSYSGLISDSSGDLFGVTASGGLYSDGTVFELTLAPMSLAFTTPPASTSAGDTLNSGTGVAVTMRYVWGGNIDTTDPFTIAVTLNGGVFSTGSNTASATAVNGVATFSNLVIDTAGTFTLTASADSSITSTSFTISPLAASTLGFIQQPTNVAANLAVSPAVTVATEDMYGNPVSTPSSTVTLTLNGGVFASGSNVATATTVSGVASFGNLVIDAAGSDTLTASGSYSTATSSGFTVSSSTPAKLAFIQEPSNAPSGVGVLPPITVAVQDRYGNPVLTDTSTVTLTLNGTTFAGGSTTATAAAVNGTATFGNLAIDTPGSYTLMASDSTDNTATATSNSFTISSQSKLGFLQPPSPATAGVALNPAVEVAVEDINGNTVTSDSSTVTLTLNGGVFAGGTNTVTATAVSGVATFGNLIIDTAASYTISASDGLLMGLTSSSFTVSPAGSAKLAFIRQPSNSGLDSPINPAVIAAVEDAFGNLVSSDSSTVTVTLNGGTFAGGSNTAASAAVNGQVAFGNLVLAAPGTYTLTATDGGLTSATSTSFGVYLLDTIASFFPYPNGANPTGPPVIDSAGDLFGTTDYGGAFNDGTVFELVHGASTTTTLATFNGTDGAIPGYLIADSNGDLFGTTGNRIFEITAGSSSITTLAKFNSSNGGGSSGSIALDSSGDLFGTTFSGGAGGYGEVFEVAKGTTSITVFASFNGTNGANPDTGVVIDSSGNIYGGTTEQDYGNEDGSIFEIRQGTSVITNLYTFTGNQAAPTVAIDTSGNVFVTAENSNTGYGSIYELAPGTSTLSTIANFNGTDGSDPTSVILDSSGDLLGTTGFGGPSNEGTLFEILHGTTSITALAAFNGANGQNPGTGLILDSLGDVYGTSNDGGPSNVGLVFELVRGASTISALAGFIALSGANPNAGLTTDSNGDLFGTAEGAGPSGFGGLFEIPRGSSTIITFAGFNQSTGYPDTGLTPDSSGDLFGATSDGGANSDGIIFEIVRGSTNITALASYSGSTGLELAGNLVLDSSGDLFGTTTHGGANQDGTVFELTHGASTITVIASFNNVTGLGPNAVILDSAGDLFGTAEGGGANSDGTVFEVFRGSSSITAIVSFNGTDGADPNAPLIFDSSGDLLGTTSSGTEAPDYYGIIFEIARGSSTLATLAAFNGINGDYPDGALTLDSSGDIFGSTLEGGVTAFAYGTVFEVPAGSSSISSLATFNGINGGEPRGSLFVDSSGDLFGTTLIDGAGGVGTVFEVSPIPPALSFTAPPASTVAGSNLAAPLGVQVAVQYSWGNIVSSDSSTVTLTLSGGTFAGGSSTATAVAVNGIATFGNLTIDAPGPYSLTASDGTDTGATSGSFNITPAQAQQLAFTQQPSTATAGVAINPAVTVAVEDSYKNTVTGDTSMVTLTLNGGTFAGGATTETSQAVNGVATFGNLTIDTVGNYMLTASDGMLAGASSNGFSVTAAAPMQLAFTQQPEGAMTGATLAPVMVSVEDSFENVVTTDSSTVTLTLSGGKFEGGSATAAAVNGVATFDSLIIDTAGSYTLTASDGMLAGATSNSFSIIPQPVDLQASNTPGSNSYAAGTNVTYTIMVGDAGPGNATGATFVDTFPSTLTGVSWTVTSSGGGTDSTFPSTGTGNINDTINLTSGGSITYTVTGTIPSSTAVGTLTDTAIVTAPSGITDSNLTNNTVIASAAITNVADLQITNTDAAGATVAAGVTETYTIVVSDAGPAAVTGAMVADAFPSSLSGVTWTVSSSGGGTDTTLPSSGSGNINDAIDLTSGGSITYMVTGTIPSSTLVGTLADTATVTVPSGIVDLTLPNNTAVASAAIINVADLQITNADSAGATVAAGATEIYTVTVVNAGPSNVTGATITDMVGTSLTGVTYTGTQTGGASGFGASGSGNISNTSVNIPAASTITYLVTGVVSQTATGTLTATAMVTAPSAANDPNTSNNVAVNTETLTNNFADLQVINSESVTTVASGTSETYTIIVSDAGPSAVTGATVADTFPSSLSGVTWTVSSSGGGTDTTHGSSGTGNIADSVSLDSGGSITYTVTGTIPPSTIVATLTDTATVTAPSGIVDLNPTNNTAIASAAITNVADLQITNTDAAGATVAAGATETYMVTMVNAGPSNVTGAAITDVIGTSLTGITYTATQTGGASGFSATGSGNINNSSVNMPTGSTITYLITGVVATSATGTLTATAVVTAPSGVTDPNISNNMVTDTDTITNNFADLQVTDNQSVATVAAGTTETYTIVVSNAGPAAVTGATVADTFPASLTGITWTVTSGGGGTDSTLPTSGSGNINDAINLTSGGSITYTVTGTIPSSTTAGTLADTATVTVPSGFVDLNLTNNTAIASAAISNVADLQITNTDTASPTVAAGATETYTVTVVNAGPSNVTGATITDVIGTSLTGVSYTATQSGGVSGFSASGSGNIDSTAVNMPAGSTITYLVTGVVSETATGTLTATGMVTAPSGTNDPNATNNVAVNTETLTNNFADLQVTDNEIVASVAAGTTETYTIVVSDAGPSGATGATVADAFASSLIGVTWTVTTSGGGTDATVPSSGSGNINDAINLNSGGAITYTVTGTVPSSTAVGTLTDTAIVTAPSGIVDLNLTNNTAAGSAAITNAADLQITNADSAGPTVSIGATDTYTVIVTNAGSSDVSGATVADIFPSTFTATSYTGTFTNGVSGVTTSSTGNITDTVNMPAGSSITYVISGTVASGTFNTLTTTASVTAPSGTFDPNASNNTAIHTDAVIATPVDIAVVVSDDSGGTTTNGNTSGGIATVNSLVTYDIVVTNTSSNAVNGVGIVDDLLSSYFSGTGSYTVVTSGGATVSTGGASPTSGNIDENAAYMPAGSSITYTLIGTVSSSAANSIVDTATVSVPPGYTDTNASNSAVDTITVVVAPTISSVVVNGNNPALAGTQASMVNSIVYTFKQAVTAGANAFTIVLDSHYNSGTVPTLSWAAVAGTGNTQWVVTFSGAGVTPGGSIGDGVYDITINASAVTATTGGLTLASNRTDVFYRLFGDAQGTGKVNASDYLLFASTFGLKSNAAGYLAEFDDEGTGKISSQDYILFANNFGTGFKNVNNITTLNAATMNTASIAAPSAPSTRSVQASSTQAAATAPVIKVAAIPQSPPAPTGSITGTVFDDKNGDGKQDKGDAGLAGWTIDIDQLVNGQEAALATAVTDKDGNFNAAGLKPGVYDVQVVAQPKKYKGTGKSLTSYHVSLGAGKKLTGYTFSEKPIS